MPYSGPYVLTPRAPNYYPSPPQTWETVELGPGQTIPPFQVFIGSEYAARRDDLPIEGPSFTAKPPERPI